MAERLSPAVSEATLTTLHYCLLRINEHADRAELELSEVTVKLHRGNVMRKMRANLHLVNPGTADLDQGHEPNARALALLDLVRGKYRGTLMLAGGFDRNSAEAWLQKGRADIIAFGRKFLANPDLPRRLRERAPLNADDTTTYYGGGAKGYTDYPTLEQERGEAPKPCVDDRWR